MLVLALDTTTAAASVALAEDHDVIAIAAIDGSQPIATRVPGELMAVLERHGVELPQIDLYGVAAGPGSFTGIRIGIATMQGLALARGRPLIGVSGFDAIYDEWRHRLPFSGLGGWTDVGVWINAYRGEVYAAPYNLGGGRGRGVVQRAEPMVGTPEDVLRAWQQVVLPDPGEFADWVFIGDGAVEHEAAIRRYFGGMPLEVGPQPLLAGAIARLALHRYVALTEAPPPHAIRPLYVRRPDAEISRDRKR